MLVRHRARVRCFYNPPRSASTRCSVAPPSRLYSDAILSSALCAVTRTYVSALERFMEREWIVERWSDKGAGFWSREGRQGYMHLTFVSRHRSTVAARVGCLLSPRHVPLCGIPAPWRENDRVSEGSDIDDGRYGACAARERDADVMCGTVGGGKVEREMGVGMCVYLVFGLDVKLDLFARQGADSRKAPLLAWWVEEGRRGRRWYLMFMVVVLGRWLWG